MYAVLPSWIEPGFGYFVQYRPEPYPAPTWAFSSPYPPDLGVSQVGPDAWHVPLGRAPVRARVVLLEYKFRPYRPVLSYSMGRGIGGRPRSILGDSLGS